jgi:hypothetical protein
VGVYRTLPREEFFYRQLVSSADFLKAYHASAHSVVPIVDAMTALRNCALCSDADSGRYCGVSYAALAIKSSPPAFPHSWNSIRRSSISGLTISRQIPKRLANLTERLRIDTAIWIVCA